MGRDVSHAATPLKPAYVIWGEDRATVERTTGPAREPGWPARAACPPSASRRHRPPRASWWRACETLSFGGARLVMVEGADEWKADDAAPLVDYLDAPNPGTCLALVAAGPP